VKPFENAIDENLGYIKVPEFRFRLWACMIQIVLKMINQDGILRLNVSYPIDIHLGIKRCVLSLLARGMGRLCEKV